MTAPEEYATIEPWLGALPSWVPAVDQYRIAAYQRYDQIYWSSEEGYEEVMRGDNDNPVFMPTARMLVNTISRYTATGFTWRVQSLLPDVIAADGTATGGDPEGVAIGELAFDALFTREQFKSKFNSEKNKGIRRGDWLFHVIGDDTKPPGRRMKILTIDPSSFFPVYEDQIPEIEAGDPEKLIRVHIAEVVMIKNQENVSRLTYERIFDSEGNQTGIQVSHGIFTMQDWAKGKSTPKRWIINPKLLPPEIPAIPIYHIKNTDATGRFGSSELRGNESVLLGINQTISDEDMALALDGIGIYATDGGPPVDAAGQQADWIMGPGRVLHNAAGLKRINGATSVTPYGDHYDRLVEGVKQASGVSDVAIGKVDSATAESGIALLLQLGPILAYTSEKDEHILDVLGQMFHDLCFWLFVYEELPLLTQNPDGEGLSPGILVQPVFGEKIPTNIKQVIEQVLQLRGAIPPLISLETALEMLRKAGLPISDNELDLLTLESAAKAAADAAAFGGVVDTSSDRTDTELAEEVV